MVLDGVGNESVWSGKPGTAAVKTMSKISIKDRNCYSSIEGQCRR